ncbi:MAG: carbon monoxide dehydrogenase subunit G [Deltaproteobacteria bacterium]|nr:carbon monoxide dehydrogenase subunit G [Deltaproteobacteria bacterium]
MKIEGAYTFEAPRERVWKVLLDPDTLQRCMPGCEKLEAIGPDQYEATLKIGVAAVKGTYMGKVAIADKEPPARYRLLVEGSGAPGWVKGEAVMELADQGDKTLVTMTADAQVGGLIAGVGQRLIGGVAKMMAGDFFKRLAEAAKFSGGAA